LARACAGNTARYRRGQTRKSTQQSSDRSGARKNHDVRLTFMMHPLYRDCYFPFAVTKVPLTLRILPFGIFSHLFVIIPRLMVIILVTIP